MFLTVGLDTAFSAANSTIEAKKVRLDKTLKALADEKDQALVKIDSTFDQHTHTIQRRATLLKNKVTYHRTIQHRTPLLNISHAYQTAQCNPT